MKLSHGFLAAGSASALIDGVPLTGNCAVDQVTMKEIGMNFDCQGGFEREEELDKSLSISLGSDGFVYITGCIAESPELNHVMHCILEMRTNFEYTSHMSFISVNDDVEFIFYEDWEKTERLYTFKFHFKEGHDNFQLKDPVLVSQIPKEEEARNEIVSSCMLLSEDDYVWGGSSFSEVMDGGVHTNPEMGPVPFVPRDTFLIPYVGNGGLIEPYWIGQSKFGSWSVLVDHRSPIPLSSSVKKSEDGSFTSELCILSDYENSEFDKRSSEPVLPLEYYVFLGPDARTVQRAFQKTVNKPTELPERSIIYNPIFSTWAIYKKTIDQEKLEEFLDEITSNGYTASNVEIDDGYEIAYGDHDFDPEKFDDISGWIDKVHDAGSNVTLWVTPFINPGSENFETVSQMNCFVKGERENGDEFELVAWWDGVGGMLDFTDPLCADWFTNHLQQKLEKHGFDGFKFDAGETNYMASNFKTRGNVLRSVDWTRAYDKTIAENFPGISEVRSGWGNQHLAIWMRMFDKDSKWGSDNGLQTMVPHLILSSLIGYQYILPDMVGGNAYEDGFEGTYVPEEELYIRWMEVTAFMPSIQFSLSPWQYENSSTRVLCKYWTDFHRDIIAPIYEQLWEDYIAGSEILPIAPVSYLAEQTELSKEVFEQTQSWIIGEKYLVAPSVTKGERMMRVYLPGRSLIWRNYFTDEIRQGGQFYNLEIKIEEVQFWERVD